MVFPPWEPGMVQWSRSTFGHHGAAVGAKDGPADACTFVFRLLVIAYLKYIGSLLFSHLLIQPYWHIYPTPRASAPQIYRFFHPYVRMHGYQSRPHAGSYIFILFLFYWVGGVPSLRQYRYLQTIFGLLSLFCPRPWSHKKHSAIIPTRPVLPARTAH